MDDRATYGMMAGRYGCGPGSFVGYRSANPTSHALPGTFDLSVLDSENRKHKPRIPTIQRIQPVGVVLILTLMLIIVLTS